MNNKELTSELAKRLGYTVKDTASLLQQTVEAMTQKLQDGCAVGMTGFGTLEVRKKMERIAVNPATGQRMLVPPKLVLTYKPASSLKEKFK